MQAKKTQVRLCMCTGTARKFKEMNSIKGGTRFTSCHTNELRVHVKSGFKHMLVFVPSHARIQKFCHRGFSFDNVFFLFFFYEGREDPNTTNGRPSSARLRNAI